MEYKNIYYVLACIYAVISQAVDMTNVRTLTITHASLHMIHTWYYFTNGQYTCCHWMMFYSFLLELEQSALHVLL